MQKLLGNYFLQQTELEKFVFFLIFPFQSPIFYNVNPSCSKILEDYKLLPVIFQLDIREFDMIVGYTFDIVVWHKKPITIFCLNVDGLINLNVKIVLF